jgi:hypothetical protein
MNKQLHVLLMSDGTDEEEDEELEATIDNSKARFVASQLISY